MKSVNDACEKDFVILRVPVGVVSFAAVFRVVMQRSYPQGEERCVKTLKTGCEETAAGMEGGKDVTCIRFARNRKVRGIGSSL